MLKCILYLKFTNFLCQSRMQDQFVGWMLYHAQDQGGQGSKIMAKIWGARRQDHSQDLGGYEARSWPRSRGKEARSWPRSRGI